MTRLAALTLALVLVVGGVAVLPSAAGPTDGAARPAGTPSGPAADSAAPTATETNSTGPPTLVTNSSARMVVDSLAREGNGTVEGRISGALSTAVDRIRTDHRSRALETEFAALGDDDERATLLGSALLGVEQRMADLRQRQRTAIRAYANGSISRTTLLRRLARIHQQARTAERHTAVILQLTDRLDIVYLDPRIQRVTAMLSSMQGPVRERVAKALDAETPAPTVHVQAGADALVLSFVEDGRYVRESVFLRNIQDSGSTELDSTSEALSRTWQFYPWVEQNRESNLDLATWESTYRVRVSHRHGQLTTYLDARSAQVFREVHRLDAPKLPRRPVRNVTENGVRVVLNRTYRGGPLRVELYDADTGAPLDGSVSLGNRTVGETGDAGRLWVVEPRTRYRLTVSVDGTTVTVTVAGEP